MNNLERRYQPSLECRADASGTITGVAAVFYDGTPTTEYRLMKNAVERIMPGAFDAVLGQDVRALFNHDVNAILGRTSAGTLTLRVSGRGLEYDIAAGNTQLHKDLIEQITRRDITGSSFGFIVAPGGDKWTRDSGRDVREIRTIGALVDVGPVTFPAYQSTSAGVRSESDIAEDVRESYSRYLKDDFARRVRARLVELDLA